MTELNSHLEHFNPESGGSIFLRNVSIYQQYGAIKQNNALSEANVSRYSSVGVVPSRVEAG
jgi:hypothetical protein